MFYSHQLLRRKSPLGQIWMAATMHAKINGKNLTKLNITKICDEILEPSVPMALRISGILMEGVVIIYQQKMNKLYEDAEKLMADINKAWNHKKVIPKKNYQAKKDAITISENVDNSSVVYGAGYIYPTPESINPIPPTPFQLGGPSNWWALGPDERDEGDGTEDPHQANPETINIEEPYQSDPFPDNNRFARFSSEGDDESMGLGDFFSENFTLIPSPMNVDIMEEQNPGDLNIHQSNVVIEARQQPKRKRERRMQQQPRRIIMDYMETKIPADQYKNMIADPSDLVGRMNKTSLPEKIAELKKKSLPPVLKLFTSVSAPFLDLWTKRSQPPSARGSAPRHPREPSASLSPGGHHGDFTGYHFEGFEMPNDNQIGSPPQGHDASPISSSSGSGSSQSSDIYPDLIKGQMKAHFDTPGGPKVESLDFFAAGMTRKKAARLFYQILVLASLDFLKVEQNVANGEIQILISKGPKM